MKVHDHLVRRCPKCGGLTTSDVHCYVKGPPLFPQMDDYTVTKPVPVVLAEDAEPLAAALRLLADRGNWQGNPESHDAILLGHDTPWEIAQRALEERE